ncbi:MAG: hypothetical protein V3573_01905 [Desulfovibrionaceae bacterium]
MTNPLKEWQERLERHFQSLARARGETGFPIFALEHGLSEDELEQISQILCSRLKGNRVLSLDWLLWVVYATERGYSYAGDEYWPSFEGQMPGWGFTDREKIKPWFRKFQKTYNGVIPSGPWAGHFSIISWPITHAILPRYLQHQFARLLYDLRFSLASLANLAPQAIGRHLAVNARYASTRFQEFLQQEELTGRIVLALLGEEPSQGKEPIYPPTLRRIVFDLEQVRNAREWLKETKRVVSDRFRGIGRGAGTTAPSPAVGTPKRTEMNKTTQSLRPGLLLRHIGGGSWSVFLEVPSFRSLATISSALQSFLQRTRCRLNGGCDMKPTGWLLSGNRKGILKSWPDPARPLVQFEHPFPALDNFLETECRLSRGSIWLFKVGNDGIAHEINGRVTRPGRTYIVVTTGALPDSHAVMSPCSVDCEGVAAFRLDIPSVVSVKTTEWLHGLGLQVSRTIRVWPAGLPGRGWDGEGKSEWLTTEAPCFGIEHDHQVDSYTFSLDNEPETTIKTDGIGLALFFRIPPLTAGMHTLSIKAFRSPLLDPLASSAQAEGFVQLKVREPEPWIPGVAAHPGLIVSVDPSDPDLDTLWRNKVRLSIFGPEGYSVILSIRLLAADGHEILYEPIGPPMNLPVKPEVWQRALGRFLTNEKHSWIYLEASNGELVVEGGTLGRYILRCEHDVLPLRWVPRTIRRDVSLRLVDDSGQNSPQQVLFYSTERPLKGITLAPDEARVGSPVAPPGGLYSAKRGDFSDALFVSTGLYGNGLQSLSVKPTFPELKNHSFSLPTALRILAAWDGARLSGPIADLRQQQVVNGLLQALYSTLYGPQWMAEEKRLTDKLKNDHPLEALKRKVDKLVACPTIQTRAPRGGVVLRRRTSFAETLDKDHSQMDRSVYRGTLWFCEVASQFKISRGRKFCEFALLLASQPHRLPSVYEKDFDRLLKEVVAVPAILLGARLLALLCVDQNDDAAYPVLPRWWEWQSTA